MGIHLPEWLKPDEPTPEMRQWQLEHQTTMAEAADIAFRCVEMTLIVGGIRLVEIRLMADQTISIFMTALLLLYVRGKVAAALYPAIERHELSEAWRRRLYWFAWAVGGAAFFGSQTVVNSVLPLLVKAQG